MSAPALPFPPAPELRVGRWQRALRGVQADALISDVPYSARTVEGQRSGQGRASSVGYAAWSREQADGFALSWRPRVRRWVALWCDHIVWRWLERAWEDPGWWTAPPVPWIVEGAKPRQDGTGPDTDVQWLFVARPRRRMRAPEARHRPGHYRGPRARDAHVVGAKPDWLMSAVVRDYSEPGDLVVDPFAGTGSTLRAAGAEGRRAVGSEVDPETHRRSLADLAFTPSLFPGVP